MTLKELRKENPRVILIVDKVVVMVVQDRQDYLNKVKTLLLDKGTYRLITVNATTKHNNTLIQIHRTIRDQGGLTTLLTKESIPLMWYP